MADDRTPPDEQPEETPAADERRAVVGHQDVSSIGVGFWAACGCSGPA